ncbi:hypothetical protein PTTG_31050, partial [Puccinia triticina 1-1 BBBD Race 1]
NHTRRPQPPTYTMARARKRPRQRSEDETDRPTGQSNNKEDYRKEDHDQDLDSAGANVPSGPESTDEQRLEHAIKLSQNQVSSAYASYDPPKLSDQLNKFNRRMIAWQCKLCSKKINRPTYDSS